MEKVDADDKGTGKVKGRVVNVLFEEQIKHLKSISVWPPAFTQEAPKPEPEKEAADNAGSGSDDDLPENPNRAGGQFEQSSGSDYDF